MRVLIPILLALALPARVSAAAPNLSAEQRQILAEVLISDADVTQEVHARFWAPLLESQDPQARETVAELARRRDLILLVQRYQFETWACALESWTEETVVRTSKLDALEAEALEAARESPGSEPKYRASFANTQLLLEAAASHSKVSTPGGEPNYDPVWPPRPRARHR